MRNISRKIKSFNIKAIFNQHPILTPIRNENGSIIVITLMILVSMTLIALASSDSTITEQYIVRNQGIYKQNQNMVEGAMVAGLQWFMQIPENSAQLTDIESTVVTDKKNTFLTPTAWYDTDPSDKLLNGSKPGVNILPLPPLNQTTLRGEPGNNLQAAFVGWEIVGYDEGGSESATVGKSKPIWRKGRLLTEYISRDVSGNDNGYGIMRMEIGVRRQLVTARLE